MNSHSQPNDERIDLDDASTELRWCMELGCSEPELRRAVAAAGPMAADVRRELQRNARPARPLFVDISRFAPL